MTAAASPVTTASGIAALADTLRAHARAAHPEECCGFLLGDAPGGAPIEAVPAVNRAPASRGSRFDIAPEDVYEAHRDAVARGLVVVGFYHSHPDGVARPSAHDIALAWPGYVYAIVARDDVRAFVRPVAGDEFIEFELAPVLAPAPTGGEGA